TTRNEDQASIREAMEPTTGSKHGTGGVKRQPGRWRRAGYLALLVFVPVAFAAISLGNINPPKCDEDKETACGSTCCKKATQQCSSAGQCVAKSLPACSAGMVRKPNGACSSGCLIGGTFFALETKNPNNDCQVCSAKSTSSWALLPHGARCEKGLCSGRGACEDDHPQMYTCGLTPTEAVRCWGRNHHGQLGDGTTTDRFMPGLVIDLTAGVSAITTNTYHACALKSDGTVMCWGANGYGQLGDGTTTEQSKPVRVQGLPSGITAVATGAFHTCAVDSARKVMCWGSNEFGQLGDGTTAHRAAPAYVTGIAEVIAISAGRGHTCAIRDNRSLYCWGNNEYGQLGIDSGKAKIDSKSTPSKVPRPLLNVSSVSAGDDHTCAVMAADVASPGVVMCWGAGQNGQLGFGGKPEGSRGPVQVSNLSEVRSVSAGFLHTCALKTDGQMVCWGLNRSGQLGIPVAPDPQPPTGIPGDIPRIVAIQAVGEHTCALQSTDPNLVRADRMLCWGYNGYGQLGYKGNSRHTPLPVGSFP
ncbi:MAG: hypothetical protein FWD57_10475, partial [Polyangiaceae bacterium]|nr:hypothetical protein [Polyangiaceae bacterium]